MRKLSADMPKEISALCFIQIFSTFSYAILYSSLALYLTKQLHLNQTLSNNIVGLFLALNYVLQLLGGIIGGQLLSNRALFVFSMLIETLGLLCLASAHPPLLYLSLSMFLVGCGLNFTSYNNMLTQRFQREDNRRETAFIFSYAAMSIGFCAGYVLSGFFDYSNHYQGLFYTGIFINFLTFFLTIRNWPALADIATPLKQTIHKNRIHKNLMGLGSTLLFIPILFLCFNSAELSNRLVVIISLVMFLVILFLGITQKLKADKERIMAYLILALTSILFWMIYFTGPIGVILFIKNNADRHLWGYEIATQWLLNINPFIIIVCAPLLSLMLNKLQKQFHFSIPMQFACGFMMLGLSFYSLAYGIHYCNTDGYVSLYWIVFYFILQGISELLIAPIGYAMIGRIAPIHLQGILMGSWMLVVGVAASLSHYFSNSMVKTQALDPLLTNQNYLQVFEELSMWAFIGALFLFLSSRKIKCFMGTMT